MNQIVQARLMLPAADALAASAGGAVLLTGDGELLALGPAALAARLDGPPLLLCHARSVARRAGRDWVRAFDLLELFAFVHPARFCLPTPGGLAEALALPVPASREDAAALLPQAAERLLRQLSGPDRAERSDPVAIAWAMGEGGWPWAPFVLAALGRPQGPDPREAAAALRIWQRLPEWQQEAPPPPPAGHPVTQEEARARLALLRGEGAEDRPQQADYASAVTLAFQPREAAGEPHVVIAEAGTGVGKTLGYLSPASVWAEKNKAPVWVSTYTRNLQHQIDQELDRLHPVPAVKAKRVVIRKGRENYLCLLNLEEAVRGLPMRPQDATALGLMLRWTAATRDGDLAGGDFPGWLAELVGRGRSQGLADRRGECIFSACVQYSRCFIERSLRRARKADIVIANHALVMVQAALGGLDDGSVPTRLVFDEGHHLFEAADGAFSGHLTGLEAAELRRWLIGSETGRARRQRGLRRRVEDLLGDDAAAAAALEAAVRAAHALPAEAWAQRLAAGAPSGPAEAFLALVRAQVYARAAQQGGYGMEADCTAPVEGLVAAAQRLTQALDALQAPLLALATRLKARLDTDAAKLDSGTRQRIEAVMRGLDRRARVEIGAWRSMLQEIEQPPAADFVQWFAVERIDGRDIDTGFHRHWIDPTRPFTQTVAAQAHGLVATSATLTDGTGEPSFDWGVAEQRTGAVHLARPAIRARVPSPYDYAAQTRIFVVRDLGRGDADQLAAAYRELFLAAGGGGLGLFTAISRLREVHGRIAGPLEAAGIPLYAQHLDGMDVATLVDIFRGEEHACLLGTDAVRDGIDVPGNSLRLIVFERVPWPRPTILHRARREAFGGNRYDDMLTRLKLRQAFGRLVRRASDRGVFVLLDSALPSRLCGAFPEGVPVRRVGLAEAVAGTRAFLEERQPDGARGLTWRPEN